MFIKPIDRYGVLFIDYLLPSTLKTNPHPSQDEFQSIICKPKASVIYFFTDSGLGPEFPYLVENNAAIGNVDTYFIDISAIPVERDPSRLPVTVLYKKGKELDFADGENMDKFFDLLEKAQYED